MIKGIRITHRIHSVDRNSFTSVDQQGKIDKINDNKDEKETFLTFTALLSVNSQWYTISVCQARPSPPQYVAGHGVVGHSTLVS